MKVYYWHVSWESSNTKRITSSDGGPYRERGNAIESRSKCIRERHLNNDRVKCFNITEKEENKNFKTIEDLLPEKY